MLQNLFVRRICFSQCKAESGFKPFFLKPWDRQRPRGCGVCASSRCKTQPWPELAGGELHPRAGPLIYGLRQSLADGSLERAVSPRPGQTGWLINVIHRHFEKTLLRNWPCRCPGDFSSLLSICCGSKNSCSPAGPPDSSQMYIFHRDIEGRRFSARCRGRWPHDSH